MMAAVSDHARRIAAGHVVVARRTGGGVRAQWACSFNSLSLAPPLLVWTVDIADGDDAAAPGARAGLSVLGDGHLHACRPPRTPPVFDWEEVDGGAPRVRDAAAAFDIRVTHCAEHGARRLYVGEVLGFTYREDCGGVLSYLDAVGIPRELAVCQAT